jgi:hypothetical protein
MAQSPDEIAKDMMVAWLSRNTFPYNSTDTPKDVGGKVGEMYQAVLRAVREGMEGQPSPPAGTRVVIQGNSVRG